MPHLFIEFGTGERTQFTNLTPVQFVSGTQSIYGVWDWNLSAWNTLAPARAIRVWLPRAATGLSSPFTMSSANLASKR